MMTLLLFGSLFLWSFLAATVLPLGSEIPLAVLIRERGDATLPVIVATVGNFLGSCTTYWLGRRAARVLAPRRPPGRVQERAARLLRRWGSPALLLSWVPLLGDALVALAGAIGLPVGRFAFWTTCGKALRYLVVAWVVLGA